VERLARRALARAVRIDLRDPYFVQVLARVSPARITLGLLAPDGPARDAVLRMLRQVPTARRRRGTPWTLLSTARATCCACSSAARTSGRLPSVDAQARGGRPRRPGCRTCWAASRPRRARRDSATRVQAALADTDLMLLLPPRAADVRDAGAAALGGAADAGARAGRRSACTRAAQQLGLGALVLPLDRCTAHWLATRCCWRRSRRRAAEQQAGRLRAPRGDLERPQRACASRGDAPAGHASWLRAARDSEESAARR
jgi:hypothetical protein